MKDIYVIANCGFDNIDDAWKFKVNYGFSDYVCSSNMFDQLKPNYNDSTLRASLNCRY
jgi:hypothetical protein